MTEYPLFGGSKKSMKVDKAVDESKHDSNQDLGDSVSSDKIIDDDSMIDTMANDDIASNEEDNDDDEDDDNDDDDLKDAYSTLSEKSKQKYEAQFAKFEEWREKRNLTGYTESVLMQYFTEKAVGFKSSTLWSIHCMLRATIAFKKGISISNYKKVSSFLRKQSKGYESKKSNIFTREEVNKFLTNAPDDKYLMQKV